MKRELRNSNDEVYFIIETDKSNGWIRGNWFGFASAEQVKSASLLYVEWLQRSPYSKILNDGRYYKGSFLNVNEWMERVCLAPAVQAGLTCFAHLVPQDLENRLALEDFCRRSRESFRVQVFASEAEAEEWLKGCR